MRITAAQLQQWADKPEAKGMLPVLVRRLISATSTPTELAIRGADSINLPGWDGTLTTAVGNAWVPQGQSRWEMGCSVDVAGKARDDLKKRTQETRPQDAAALDFIFVSPRRWLGKDEWREKADEAKHWNSIRAYDADDLEAWLEAAPSVSLWFGEQLGLQGAGIESISTYWDTWRNQTKIPITTEAISTDRESCVEALRDALSKAPPLIVLEADSTEEAVAFICAELIAIDLTDAAACITSQEGWRYVDANPQLRILVASTPEIAATRAAKDGLTLIVPVNIGDRPEYFSPKAAQTEVAQHLRLDRSDIESFKRALVNLGEEESDAARLSRTTGRSWSVYRRVRATNPAIARPAWMKDPASRCLTTIALVGGWDEKRAGDISCLETVTGKKYEEIERDLLQIARIDDSPILKIGTVWKAKAPLELLHLSASLFTQEELNRFFAATQAILAKPDPALQLDPSQRWMASIHGKAREESGIVIDSIVDSIAKLSVFAENNGDNRITSRIDKLIRTLLDDADGARWLSLSGVLRELAEASPDVFLHAIEGSLRRTDAPILQLFSDSNHDSFHGRSWHVDLLWALEIIAWSPKYLSRVIDILAQLTASPLPRNLMNRPMNSLLSLFRPWWPQTTSTPELRIAALDRLIQVRPDVAWELLVALIPKHFASASANAKPHWRDDDAGAIGPNDIEGFGWYQSEIGARVVAQAAGNPVRIATLVESLDSFDDDHRERIVTMIAASLDFSDNDREIIRSALRKYLSWHYSYSRREGGSLAMADRLRPLFDALQPTNLVIRHAWLFQNGWVEMPDGREADYKDAERCRDDLRKDALRHIFYSTGWKGIEELTRRANTPGLVGWQIARADLSGSEVATWAIKYFTDAGSLFHDPVLTGLVHALSPEHRSALMKQAAMSLNTKEIAAFASSAPCDRETWTFLEGQPIDVSSIYWRNINPGASILESKDITYLIDHLVEAGRHRTAFQAIQFEIDKADPTTLFELLEAISMGADPEQMLPDAWRIGEAVQAIAKSGSVSRRQLAFLEFRYFQALRYSQHGTKNLYEEMLDDPSLFLECVCLVYRPRSQPHTSNKADDAVRAAASLGWDVLHHGRGIPGQLGDGGIDRSKFNTWIVEARKRAAKLDRSIVTDITIGEWLSSCPPDADGTWPCEPVRDLFEQPDTDKIRDGFYTGVFNNRGVHSRAMFDGGNQERELAARYRAFAAPLQGSHPHTASILESIAKGYDAEGKWHDQDSALLKEGAG